MICNILKIRIELEVKRFNSGSAITSNKFFVDRKKKNETISRRIMSGHL